MYSLTKTSRNEAATDLHFHDRYGRCNYSIDFEFQEQVTVEINKMSQLLAMGRAGRPSVVEIASDYSHSERYWGQCRSDTLFLLQCFLSSLNSTHRSWAIELLPSSVAYEFVLLDMDLCRLWTDTENLLEYVKRIYQWTYAPRNMQCLRPNCLVSESFWMLTRDCRLIEIRRI